MTTWTDEENGGTVWSDQENSAVNVSAFMTTVLNDVDAQTARTTLGAAGTTELAASTGSSLVGFIQSGTGALSESLQDKIRRGMPLEPQDFMTATEKADVAAYTYGQNVTAALLSFFNACITYKHHGYIGPGGYLITKGQLAFDCAFTDTAWPVIKTAGHQAVIFKATASTDAPFIAITNGTANSAVGQYWRGGELGGITLWDSSGASASSAHGIKLVGVWGTKFGYIKGNTLRADVVNCPETLYSSTNPDPYAVSACYFYGIEAVTCVGGPLNNQNYVGFNGNRVRYLRATDSGSGVTGLGTQNAFENLSFANITPGWCIDDRTTNTGGGSSKNEIGFVELDNCQLGLRLNFTRLTDFKQVRFIHRYQTSPNTDANYWPRTAVSLAPTGSPSVKLVRMNLWHRLESGGALSDLGDFVDGNSNANITDVVIDQTVSDNGPLGYTTADLYTNISGTSRIVLTEDGLPFLDTRIKVASIMRGSANGTALTIGSDPVTTVNGSNVVTVAMTGHGLVANQCFTLQGATITNGIPAAELNRSHPVTSVVDANNVTVTVETNATGSGAGGGAGCSAAANRSFLNIAGFGTAKAKLALPTETSDRGAYNDSTLYQWLVPYTGLYRVFAKIRWTGLAAGNRVRLGIYHSIHTSPILVSYSEMRCQGANPETLQVQDVVSLTAGQLLSVNCDCNASAAIAMSFVGANDVGFSVVAI